MTPTTVRSAGGGDTFERIEVHGIQPGRAEMGGKVSTSGIERSPLTAPQLEAAIAAGQSKIAALELEVMAVKARLATVTSREAEREVRRERSETWEALRAWRLHVGLLQIELRSMRELVRSS